MQSFLACCHTAILQYKFPTHKVEVRPFVAQVNSIVKEVIDSKAASLSTLQVLPAPLNSIIS
jgi:hypothetical protein